MLGFQKSLLQQLLFYLGPESSADFPRSIDNMVQGSSTTDYFFPGKVRKYTNKPRDVIYLPTTCGKYSSPAPPQLSHPSSSTPTPHTSPPVPPSPFRSLETSASRTRAGWHSTCASPPTSLLPGEDAPVEEGASASSSCSGRRGNTRSPRQELIAPNSTVTSTSRKDKQRGVRTAVDPESPCRESCCRGRIFRTVA